MLRRCFSILLLLGLILLPQRAFAQDPTPDQPIYIVQAGDTFYTIAIRFGLSLDELENANPQIDPNRLKVGDQLVLPGLEGVKGVITAQEIHYGDSLVTLSRRYRIPIDGLVKLNHITSPAELYVGGNVILPEPDPKATYGEASLAADQTLLELAAKKGTNLWTLVEANGLKGSWDAAPGEFLVYPSEGNDTNQGEASIYPAVESIEINPYPLVQGKTEVIRITTREPVHFSGSLVDHELHFFQEKPGTYVALQGVYAMLDKGIYPLTIQGELENDASFKYSQMVIVKSGGYVRDLPLTVPPETLDPKVTGPENDQYYALAAPATETKYWDGAFDLPSKLFTKAWCLETNECWSARFGSRRSYNGGPYDQYHTGLDIFGGKGVEIYAPAPGVVVFTGLLTVRGNTTLIDHGWGVYSGYFHQSEIRVKAGDRIQAGQIIGLIGNTGRAEGPHLHFEILVGGVQVDPLDWLGKAYP
ncbi:MAG TPA: peptidoglycan DD-metalloendopeptidase family protein [Anaerolineaceae bacterium]|nr:peptidoglycan DD-metalloendopeptidase family protein [Anaerolineaceae bacterium]